MNVDDVTNALKSFDGDMETALVIATDGKTTTVCLKGSLDGISVMLTSAAEKDKNIRRVIGFTAAALIMGG